MRGGGRLAAGAEGAIAVPAAGAAARPAQGGGGIPSWLGLMLYSSMKHRTQLYLDDGQYRWLRQRAGASGSIAAVVRQLIDAERARLADPHADPLLRYLVGEAPGRGRAATSVATLDRDLYG
jgi:hypothetical protein